MGVDTDDKDVAMIVLCDLPDKYEHLLLMLACNVLCLSLWKENSQSVSSQSPAGVKKISIYTSL